jgi:hypothetical protein
MPSTVKAPDVQWEGGAAGDLYRVIATGGLAKVTAYLLHDGGAFKYDWRADAAVWDLLKRSTGTAPITFTVDRVTPGAAAVHRSTTRSVNIVQAEVAGAIYYWDLSDGKILRITPAGRDNPIPNPPAKNVPGAENDGSRCVACHTVSRNGRYMAGALWGGGEFGAVFDLAADLTPDPAPTVFGVDKYRTLCSTFNPDATRLLVNEGKRLFLIDAKTGAEVPTLGTPLPTDKAAHPTWSPDGASVAYIANHDGGWAVDFTLGDLAIMPVTGPDTFGPTTILSPADGLANTWPSFSPDSNWIAFGRGTNSRGRNTLPNVGVVQYPGSLWLIGRGDGTPVELVNANGGPGKQDSYLPNFSPFNEGGYFWLTFYSTRDYGNAQAGTKGKARRQLWVTAVKNAPTPGQDPSSVPFWLPDQSVETENIGLSSRRFSKRSSAVCCVDRNFLHSGVARSPHAARCPPWPRRCNAPAAPCGGSSPSSSPAPSTSSAPHPHALTSGIVPRRSSISAARAATRSRRRRRGASHRASSTSRTCSTTNRPTRCAPGCTRRRR